MDRAEIKALLQAKPFEQFTVHVVDGDLLGVRSPEYMWLPPVGATVFIIVPKDDDEGRRADLGELKILGLEYISHVTVGPISGLRFPAS